MSITPQRKSDFLTLILSSAKGCYCGTVEDYRKPVLLYGMIDSDLSCHRKEVVNERTLIFCESDYESILQNYNFLGSKLKNQNCEPTSFIMPKNDQQRKQLSLDRKKFGSGETMLAFCSVNAFYNLELAFVDHYIFYGTPKDNHFAKILDIISVMAKTQECSTRVDLICSDRNPKERFQYLSDQLTMRGYLLPRWLKEFTSPSYVPPSFQPTILVRQPPEFEVMSRKVDDMVMTSSNTYATIQPTTSTSTESTKKVVPIVEKREVLFDPHNITRNADGKYIVPANCVTGWSDDDEEGEDAVNDDENDYHYVNSDHEDDYISF